VALSVSPNPCDVVKAIFATVFPECAERKQLLKHFIPRISDMDQLIRLEYENYLKRITGTHELTGSCVCSAECS